MKPVYSEMPTGSTNDVSPASAGAAEYHAHPAPAASAGSNPAVVREQSLRNKGERLG